MIGAVSSRPNTDLTVEACADMRAFYFTEMPYPYVPEEVEQKLSSARIVLPNSYLDPKVMADLYNRYLDEYLLADDLGLEIMLNEHHQTLTCLDVAMPLSAAALARQTKRAQILLLGTPLPHRDSPVRVAEEIAMLDCISRGRILSGFVRGVSTEILPANTNPVQTRARFEEAHELIVKAWTTGEPFNWEGRFWQYRYVNVWPRPYQQPHPPIWTTGSSPASVPWAADHQYTYACFMCGFGGVKANADAYRTYSAEQGLPAFTPDKLAYAALCYTGETDEQAEEEAKGLLWYPYRARHPYFANMPGYYPLNRQAQFFNSNRRDHHKDSFENFAQAGIVIAGSPYTMIKKLTYLQQECGAGNVLMMNQAGFMPTESVRRSLKLFAEEVYPAIKDLGEMPAPAPAPAGVA
jgi:alkanesulfonate monooxygenase SsuD/methylene tetrahydromethanopterin reductase-like flavin-dependent oxidoreductase (luciferase family)